MAEKIGFGSVDAGGYFRQSWNGLENGDTGRPCALNRFSEASVQITGTFGTDGEIVIEGSNDSGSTWSTLRDSLGGSVNFTAAGLAGIMPFTGIIRPRVVDGDGTTDLNVYLVGPKPA